MSKRYQALAAGAFIFCIFNHQTYGCPICVDTIGSIKKPFFMQEDGEIKKASGPTKQRLSLHKKCFLKSGETL
jgi:hypothetical protein